MDSHESRTPGDQQPTDDRIVELSAVELKAFIQKLQIEVTYLSIGELPSDTDELLATFDMLPPDQQAMVDPLLITALREKATPPTDPSEAPPREEKPKLTPDQIIAVYRARGEEVLRLSQIREVLYGTAGISLEDSAELHGTIGRMVDGGDLEPATTGYKGRYRILRPLDVNSATPEQNRLTLNRRISQAKLGGTTNPRRRRK